MNPILLATDGSPSAAEALRTAVDLAEATGWPLRVVTVWMLPPAGGYFAPAHLAEMNELEHDYAVEVMKAAVADARASGVEAVCELRRGDASHEICKAAEQMSARLIVVGAHGWGALKRLVFGSVSTTVLHEAPCPVLVVRAPPDAAKHEGVIHKRRRRAEGVSRPSAPAS